jgi:hypothetical protein
MLLLYGLVYVYIIVFFALFALISTGYLIAYLIRRSLSRSGRRKYDRAGLAVNRSGGIQLAGE